VTQIPVLQVVENTKIEPDHIYVVPPNKHLVIQDGFIAPSVNVNMEERRAPVDIFFRNLAETHGSRAVCVVLSGTGANGSMGLKRIKELGGAAFVQNPREAEFNEMPRNSIATDLVDEVLPVAEIPSKIIAYRNSLGTVEIVADAQTRPEAQQQALREIFTLLRVRTGHDFSNYKRATLLRRIERRINIRNLPDLPSYTAFLQQNQDEPNALLKDLLISVTNFYRDSKSFNALEQEVLPAIMKAKNSDSQVRIWIAGCATGEEAYSIAMLCAEKTAGIIDAPKVQIFATDIDESAISIAREGYYTINDAADVSPDRLRRFFNKEGDSYRVKREIREMILFANHNFLKDPPFSRLDLISCRNVMIYLNNTAQERVLETFHFALIPGGYLFLGSSESVDGASDLYATVSREHHIFQARTVASRSYPVPESVPAFKFVKSDQLQKPDDKESLSYNRISLGELHQKLLEQYAPPSVVVNEEYEILHMSDKVGKYFEFQGGEPTQNLLKLIRPELRLELRSALYQAVQHKTAVEARNVKLKSNGHLQLLDLHVRPVLHETDMAKGFILIIFKENENSQDAETIETIMVSSNEPVAKQLEEELIHFKTQLRNSVAQHEFQAEELKASNEELQAMNEELRSAAEELETSKEELQSINEELRTVNQELKVKIEETSVVSNNLQNLINSANIGTIFLDRNFCTRMYTPATLEIFNLIPSDYGRPISDITHRLRYDQLLKDAETVLEKLIVVEREVTTTDNRFFLMRILPYRTTEDRINGVVITFFDISKRKEAEKALQQSEEHLRLLIESAKDYAIFTLDTARRITSWSTGAEMMTGFKEAEIIGRSGDMIFTPEDKSAKAPEKEGAIAIETGHSENERWHLRKDNSRFWASGSVSPLRDNEGNLVGLVKIMRDLTEKKQMEEDLRKAEEKYRTQLEHDVEKRTAELNESKELFQAIMNSSLNMIQVFEAVRNESGEIIDFRWILNNHASERMYGDVIGKSLLTLNPGVIEEGIFDAFKNVVETGRSEIEERHYVHEQSDGWFYQSVVKLGDGVVTSTIDITHRKNAELQIRSAKEFLQYVIDSSLDMIMVLKAVRNNDGKIVDFTWLVNNSKSIELFGEVTGKSMLQQNPGIVTAGIFDRMVEVTESGLPQEQELYYAYEQFPDNWFYMAIVKHDDGVILTTRDITWQKKAEQELLRLKDELAQQANNRYRTLFESIDEGYCIIEVLFDADGKPVDWLFLEVNPAFEKNNGLKDAVGKTILELAPDIEPKWFDIYGRIAKTGNPLRFEEHSAAQGSRWFNLYAFRVGKPEENRVAVVFTDITERKRSEEALSQSEARFRTLADAIPQVIWTNDENGKSDYFNQRWYEYTGLTFEQSYEVGWEAIVHPDDAPAAKEAWRNSQLAGNIFETEFRLRNKEGIYSWFIGRNVPLKDHEGKITGWFGSATDIEKLKHAEELLQSTSDRLHIALEAGQLGSYEYDFKTKQISGTAQLREVLGFTAAETLTFDGFMSLVLPDERHKLELAGIQAIKEHTVFTIEFRIQSKTGGVRWIKSSGRCMYNEKNEPQKLVGITLDITEQKLFTEELTRLVNERTIELQRSNEDLRQFAHVASHDLKEPIRKIKTFNNKLKDEFGELLHEKAKLYLNKIDTSTDRIFSMIEGILTYSMVGKADKSIALVNLNWIIDEIKSELEVLILNKKATITSTELPTITGKPILLLQLFYNLVLNSLKFVREDVPAQINISSEIIKHENADFVKITISDNGIGFDPEFEETIFQPFSRLNSLNEYEGTGLGLALCKKITERHGGQISARGELNKGAVFTLLLPLT
jgi:PAS domain S-box-containing protein